METVEPIPDHVPRELVVDLARVIHEPAALVCPELDRCLAA